MEIKITGLSEEEVQYLLGALYDQGWQMDIDIEVLYGASWTVTGVQVQTLDRAQQVIEFIQMMRGEV